jgi:hypothetical protein
MRTQMKQVMNLSIIVGASALLGCASFQTADKYAISHGYQPTQIEGREYFCRLEQPAVAGEPQTDSPQRLLVCSESACGRPRCLTRNQIVQIQYAESPADFFVLPQENINGGPYDSSYHRDHPIPSASR